MSKVFTPLERKGFQRLLFFSDLALTGFILIIRAYQICLSPLLPHSCRFYPSCSQYAIDAFKKYGFLKGLYRSIRRVLCCHPFHPGGIDPA